MTNSMKMNRRAFTRNLSSVGVAALAAPSIFTGRAFAADSQITVTSWGGNYHKMVREVFADPFTEETGIKVQLVDNADMAKVKAQVLTNAVEWDVIDVEAQVATTGVKENLWETLDPELTALTGLIDKPASHYMPFYLYSGGLLWNRERNPDGEHPVDFTGFFDVERFPGRRCLKSEVNEVLEMALVADGVAPADLYPLDVERAFAKLDQLKANVSKFSATTPEQVNVVVMNEADFSYSYYNRVKSARESGSPLDFSFEQTCNSVDSLAVPRGSKNKEAAMRFISFCLGQKVQENWALAGFFLPNSRAAFDAIKATPASSFLPDMSSSSNVIVNAEWWGDNFTDLQRRYSEWIIS